MSDEAHIESAYRHRSQVAVCPWHGMSPDEEMMAKEEGYPDPDADAEELMFQYNSFLSYSFADARPEEWRAVAARAHAIARQGLPAFFATWPPQEVVTQSTRWEADGYGWFAESFRSRPDLFARVLGHFFKPQRDWLKAGVEKMYLVARGYRPGLVTNFKVRDLTFTQLAVIFGEIPENAPREAQDRARSRWSAKASTLIRKPIEAAGEKVPALFGKSSVVREKYRAAARGNRNRRGAESSCGDGAKNDKSNAGAVTPREKGQANE